MNLKQSKSDSSYWTELELGTASASACFNWLSYISFWVGNAFRLKTFVYNSCSQLSLTFLNLCSQLMLITFDHKLVSHVGSQLLVNNFCSQLGFKPSVQNFCSYLFFTAFVYNYCLQRFHKLLLKDLSSTFVRFFSYLLLTIYCQIFGSQLLSTSFLHMFYFIPQLIFKICSWLSFVTFVYNSQFCMPSSAE